jgi:hypothetical protein
VSSRVAHRPANFVIPTLYRLAISSRSFSHTGDQLASEKAAAKPRAKKSATTSAGKKKPAAKKAAGAKKTKVKKPAAKKAAPKRRVRKELSPEEKAKQEIRELKKIALLQEPKKLPDQAWLVYVAQNTKNLTPQNLGETIKGLSADYNSLGSFEKEVCAPTPHHQLFPGHD